MSDEQQKLNLTIVRNDVPWTLELSPFSKKSPHVGKSFPTPVVNEANFQDYVKWFGLTEFLSYINNSVRVDFMGIYTDNIDEKTGIFNAEKWAIDAADFTAGVTKLSAVEEQMEELQAKQYERIESPDFGAEGAEGTPTEAAAKIDVELKEINGKLKTLKVLKADLLVKIGEKAAKRKATKEANELKAKLAKEAFMAGQTVNA